MRTIGVLVMVFSLSGLLGCTSTTSENSKQHHYSAVEAVSDLGSPGNGKASDDDVLVGEEIRQALLKDRKLAPAPSRVVARVQDGVVTLSGNVPSANDKAEMLMCIKNLPGVARVDDELEVGKRGYSGR